MRPPTGPSATPPPPRSVAVRVPLPVWIVLGVVLTHVLFLWLVADKHYLPEARYVPPPPTPNFAGGTVRSVDPRTGEGTTESQFVVSTVLAPPRAKPSPGASPGR